MRLFFIEWSGPKLGFTDVVLELRKQGHEIVYWSAPHARYRTDKSLFPGTIFHEYDDALRAIAPRGLDTSEFYPPGEEIIKQLAGAESTVLTMMNKLFENMTLNERKHLYYRHVGYWHAVLQKFRPDLIIFPVMPHTVYDFVAYSIAKLLHIKTLFFMLTRVGDRVLAMNDCVAGSVALQKEISKIQGKNFTLDDLSKDIRESYKAQNNSLAKPTPQDIIDYSAYYSGFNALRVKARSFWTTLTVLKDFGVFLKIATCLFRRFLPNQKKEYKSLESLPDLNKKFIYVALNQQPENTTSPLGGIFVDQILMIETLSASLPEGWLIYVKEHPLQWKPRGLDYFSYRYRGYYKSMAVLPNIRIVPVGTDSFALINKSQCVATVNGTAGWEAVLRGKPSLVFGYAWYRDCPGVFRVNSVISCRDAIGKVAMGTAGATEQQVINYLFAFGSASIRAYTDEYLLPMATVSLENSVANYVKAIVSEL